MTRLVFDGWIAGLGTGSGHRLVLGHWPVSPYGPVSDVMLESPEGHRTLFAPTGEVGAFVAATYVFDDVRISPVDVQVVGDAWDVSAGALRLSFRTGPRRALGRLLRAVPGTLARRPGWVALLDPPARVLLHGVRTRGSARQGRREWYGARDLLPILTAGATLGGVDLGEIAEVSPPVRFGFGSVPRRPALVRLTTTVEIAATQA